MHIEWGKIAPVLVSIGIIITVALLRNYSRTFAAIAATMPINIPLGLWIVASGGDMTQTAMVDFTQQIFLNMLPTVVFALVVWWLARQGWALLPSIGVGYVAWGVGLLGLLWATGRLGR
jgi:Na+/H+-dicarboxylate symporter